jgi:8-oxo-dGTP pyrophosphatase MutT (NUDIX family)
MISPSEPKSASTVALLRPGATGGIEALLTRRPDAMDFLGGAYVFPGGTVRAEDYSSHVLKRCRGVSPLQARNILGAHLKPEIAVGHWIAGIRELFEEVGVLLWDSDTALERKQNDLEQQRRSIVGRESSFAQLLERDNSYCDAGQLLYFSHWLTPEEFAMRFDTRFFIALLPRGQTPLERSEEVAESLWISPERAMQLYAAGKLPMIFPTYASLRTLADFETIDAVLKQYGNVAI